MPQNKKTELAEMRRFAKMLAKNDIPTSVKLHELDPDLVRATEYPEVIAKVPRPGRKRPWHIRLVNDELPRADTGERNRTPYSVSVDGGHNTKTEEQHGARTLYDAEHIFVQMIVKYRGRRQGRPVKDDTYQANLPRPNPSTADKKVFGRMKTLAAFFKNNGYSARTRIIGGRSEATANQTQLFVQPIDKTQVMIWAKPARDLREDGYGQKRRAHFYVRVDDYRTKKTTTKTRTFVTYHDAESFFVNAFNELAYGRKKALEMRRKGDYQANLPGARRNPRTKS